MKKIKIIAITAAMLAMLSTAALADDAIQLDGFTFNRNTDTWYCVNDKFIDFNSNGIYTDTLVTEVAGGSVNLMPIRAFAESIGAELMAQADGGWYIKTTDGAICVYAGRDSMEVYKINKGVMSEAQNWRLNCPIVEYNGVTYIPFRSAICALFGIAENKASTTDKIKVREEGTGYRIFADREYAPILKEKKDVAHDVRIIAPDGSEHTIAVAKKEHMVNPAYFEKYLREFYWLDVLEGNIYAKTGNDFVLSGFDASNADNVTAITYKGLTIYVEDFNGEAGNVLKSDLSTEFYYGKEIPADNYTLAGNVAYVKGVPDSDYTHVRTDPSTIVTLTIDGAVYTFDGFLEEAYEGPRYELSLWNKSTLIVGNGNTVYRYTIIDNGTEYTAMSDEIGKYFAFEADYSLTAPIGISDIPNRRIFVRNISVPGADIKVVGGESIESARYITINGESFLQGDFTVSNGAVTAGGNTYTIQ